MDQSLVSEYRTDIGAKPFLFPLVGPTGSSYTRAYPMETLAGEDRDHPHQRSFWFTHGKVNGVDFWSEEKGHGTIKETARKSIVSGPMLGRLCTSDDWIGPDGRKVCEDERMLTFYKTRNARVIDFEIVLKATEGPVTFGDTKEGMFGLRVASSMDVDRKRGGRIVNAEGLVDDRGLGQGVSLGGLLGPGQREDRRNRDPQSSRQLQIPHDMARANLWAVRRQPFRLARFRLEQARRLHAPCRR